MRSILGIALLCLAHAATAQQVRCVSTVAQLEAAAQIAADEEVEIRLVTGTYDVTQTCLDLNPIASCDARDNKLSLRGGYDSGCTARSADPALTVITAPGRNVELIALQDSADLAIDRLTFRDIDFLRLILEGLTEGNYKASIDRVWFDRIGQFLIDVDTLLFRNSIVSRSGFGGPYPGQFAGALSISSKVDNLRFEGNTIVDNAREFHCYRCAGIARNNVFWNNSVDVRIFSASEPEVDLTLINNTITTITGDPLAVAPVGSSTTNPLFVNAAAQNYRLQNT
jgi:hypothetical protein